MSSRTPITCVLIGAGGFLIEELTSREVLAKASKLLAPGDELLVRRGGACLRRTRLAGGGFSSPSPGPARAEALFFFDWRIEASHGLLSAVRAALAGDEEIVAVAARTNVADGDELLLGVPYRPGATEDLVRFLRGVASQGPEATEVECLLGPTLGLNRAAVAQLGGTEQLLSSLYSPGAWSNELRHEGGRLRVLEHAYVHHPGGLPSWPDPRTVGRPFISACLIVKDEAQNLERCLGSALPVADEIVVYDTGSTDGTQQLAAGLGARVIEGYWDDDFARARNDALEYCKGQWILWLDADEALVTEDPTALRNHLLQRLSAVEGYIVMIDNLRGTETANVLTHPACRVFRRANGHWDGRIHEQILARAGQGDLVLALMELVRITHWGYLQSTVAKRDKGARNLRTAFLDLAAGSDLDPGMRLCSLGRSYMFANRYPEGIELCELAASVAERPATRRLALRGQIEGLLISDRNDEAIEVARTLAKECRVPNLARLLEGQARFALGELEAARACFESIEPGLDDDGFEYTADFVAAPLAVTLLRLGEHDAAARVLIDALEHGGGIDAHLGVLLDAMSESPDGIDRLFDVIGPARVRAFLPQVVQLEAETADLVLEAWFARDPGHQAILATAASVAPRLSVERQLVWSHRLRALGYPSACPLVHHALDPRANERSRLLAATVAALAFEDPRAAVASTALYTRMDEHRRRVLTPELSALAPALERQWAEIPPARFPAPPQLPRANGRTLLIDNGSARIRTSALATVLAATGRAVTVLEPEPGGDLLDLLGAHGVVLRTVPVSDTGVTSRNDALARGCAVLSAETRFDVVVLSAPCLSIAPRIRALLPLVVLGLDLDGLAPVDLDPSEVDFALTTHDEAPALPVPCYRFPASSGDVLRSVGPVPPALRRGVGIVGDPRVPLPAGADASIALLCQALAALEGETALFCFGEDRTGQLAGALAGASFLAELADPAPWLAAVRVLVVASAPDAEHWLDAAARAGTPALLWPSDANEAAQLGQVLRALSADDALLGAFAPAVAPPRSLLPVDPLSDLPAPLAPRPAATDLVRLVGDFESQASLAQVNRALFAELSRDPLLLVERHDVREPPPRGEAAVEIRHLWPPDFTPPATGQLVLIQPWEFGGLPAEWIAPLRDVVAELWVPSNWVRDCAIESGLSPERVAVVPNGVDAARFTPDGAPFALRTSKRFRFLFVGGLIERKGVDALLEAYLGAFSAADDVCLVVKPFGSSSVYANSTLEPALRQAAAGNGAAIEFVEEDLNPSQMAALYRTCDVLVHPYRGEGFGLPIAEAMASGTPPIVTAGGAADDFCDDEVAWMIGARKVGVDLGEFTPSKAGAWWLEPSRRDLMDAMREAVARPDLVKARGAAARRRIATQFSWAAAAEAARTRLAALLDGALPAFATTGRDQR